MKTLTCPRFESCSAPICPIDDDWRLRTHRKGEAVCHWVRQLAKAPAGDAMGSAAAELLARVLQLIPELFSRHAAIKTAFHRAARSGSKSSAFGHQSALTDLQSA